MCEVKAAEHTKKVLCESKVDVNKKVENVNPYELAQAINETKVAVARVEGDKVVVKESIKG